MKEFTFYGWRADDESGVAICRSEEFSPRRSFNPESGWRARPSFVIGEFNTVEELAEIVRVEHNNDPVMVEYFGEMSVEESLTEAGDLFHWYKEDLED